tara:strand:+ start:1123 stop:1608 length:486 start_codon:yes stop_codon:yes gene_type:complete
MKELLLFRHAKSSWESLVEDRNRGLTDKGIERTKDMAVVSSKIIKDFEVFFSSPANRAIHTASILIHELQIPFELLQIREALYTFEIYQLLSFIKSIPDHYSKVICVGHNPAMTNAVNQLSTAYLDHLPTAAWALIKFEQRKWRNVQNGKTSLGLPKEILK